MEDSLKNGILLAIFSVIVLGAVWNRPIVGYKLDCISSNFIKLGVRNSGNTNSALMLKLYCQNASISSENKKTYQKIENNSINILFTASSNMDNYYFGENVELETNDTVDSFSCSYEVSKRFELSISGLINLIFGEVKGYYPTVCEYERVGSYFSLKNN